MKISQRSIEEVREATDIVEVASEFTALRRQGTRHLGLCPYPDHTEKTPSFSVSPDRGFYYCFGCLEANERIWTSRGLIPIAAVEIGDQVIGLNGQREFITDKEIKSGQTLRIKTGAAKEGIRLTPDHWCVFVKKNDALLAISGLHHRSRHSERIRFSNRLRNRTRPTKLSVEHASSIEAGDFWLYPVIPDEDRADKPLLGDHVIKPYTKGPRTERITELHVNADTAWLYGIWLAEGSLYGGGVKWSFGAHESESLAEKVLLILEEEFGRAGTKFVRPEKNNCEVTCSSTDLASLFGYWFGGGCQHKRVPTEALNWTTECQEAFVKGYVDGDGYTRYGMTRVATVSEELAYGIFALCIQTRKACSMNSTPARTDKDGVGHKKAYAVHMLCKESVKGFFAPINGTMYFWSAVQETETCHDESETVVDITTTGSHTFLTKMGITHNCQKGGDAIKLVMDLKSLSFAETISHLAERSGIELEFEGRSPEETRAVRQKAARRRAAHKALATAAVYYHKYLLKSSSPEAQKARSYLEERGLERSTIVEFRLGYAPAGGSSGLMRSARKLSLDRRAFEAAGLLSARGGERFSGRITFPISDRRGRIVGFGARAMGEEGPKYLNSPETELFNKRELLYGFPQVAEAIRRDRVALVVEGYTDVLMLYQSGIQNAVATLGTATTPAHLRVLSGYADRIYLLFDPDAAGEKAVERAAATVAELKLDLRVLRLPGGLDPADWMLEHEVEEFAPLLEHAVPVLEYVFRRKAEHARGADAAERSRIMLEIKDLMGEMEDPVFRREALRLASESLGVPLDALENPRPFAAQTSTTPRPQTDHHQQAGREVLALVLARPDLAANPLKQGITAPNLPEPVILEPDDFADDDQARLFSILRDHAGNLDGALSDERARPLLNHVAALSSEGEKLYPSEASINEAWLRLRILSRQTVKRNTPDYSEKDRLRSEIDNLTEALRTVAAG